MDIKSLQDSGGEHNASRQGSDSDTNKLSDWSHAVTEQHHGPGIIMSQSSRKQSPGSVDEEDSPKPCAAPLISAGCSDQQPETQDSQTSKDQPDLSDTGRDIPAEVNRRAPEMFREKDVNTTGWSVERQVDATVETKDENVTQIEMGNNSGEQSGKSTEQSGIQLSRRESTPTSASKGLVSPTRSPTLLLDILSSRGSECLKQFSTNPL